MAAKKSNQSYTIKNMSKPHNGMKSDINSKKYPYYLTVEVPPSNQTALLRYGVGISDQYIQGKARDAAADLLYQRLFLLMMESMVHYNYLIELSSKYNQLERFLQNGTHGYSKDSFKWLLNRANHYHEIVTNESGVKRLDLVGFIPETQTNAQRLLDCNDRDVLGDHRKYLLESTDEFLEALYSSVTHDGITFDRLSTFDDMIAEIIAYDKSIDSADILAWHDAVKDKNKSQFMIISNKLLRDGFNYTEDKFDLVVDSRSIGSSRNSVLLKIPFFWTGMMEAVSVLGDRVAFIPTAMSGYNRIKPSSAKDGQLSNSHYYVYENKNNYRQHYGIVDRGLLVFQDEEAVKYVVENVKGFNQPDIISSLMGNRAQYAKSTPTIRHYNADVAEVAEGAKNVELKVNARKTFFDKKTRKTFVELNASVIALSLTLHGESTLPEIDDPAGFIRDSIENHFEHKRQELLQLFRTIRDNDVAYHYGAYLTLSNLSPYFYRFNPAAGDTIVGDKRGKDNQSLRIEFSEIVSETTKYASNVYKSNYRRRGSEKTQIKLGDHTPEQVVDDLKEILIAYAIEDGLYNVIKTRKSNESLRWKSNYPSQWGVDVCLTLCVGMNSSEAEVNAVKRTIKLSKITKTPNFSLIQTYPYLGNSEVIEELLKIIAYV